MSVREAVIGVAVCIVCCCSVHCLLLQVAVAGGGIRAAARYSSRNFSRPFIIDACFCLLLMHSRGKPTVSAR